VKTWEIIRRFTEFEEFHKKMAVHLKEKKITVDIPFPKKAWFRTFSESGIEKRKKGFENYLNKLSDVLNLIDYPEACDFFGIEKIYRTLLSSLEFEEKKEENNIIEIVHKEDEDPITSSTRKEMIKIKEFLKKINDDSLSIAKSVNEFDTFYFENEIKLKKKEIKLLLWGDTESNMKGLLHYSGDLTNFIARSSCLQLFSKFIKYEYNSEEVDKFLKVYGMTDPKIIKQMNLEKNIKEITTLDGGGILALYYYLTCNIYDIGDSKEILEDQESIEEYEKWLKNKIICGNKYKNNC